MPTSPGQDAIAARVARPANPLILIADDDPGIRNYLCQLMEHEGCRVITAVNGRQAVELAQSEGPDLITMDLRMPDMDGRAAIDCLNNAPDLSHIPVIVISEISIGSTHIGDAFIDKPIDEDLLLASIGRLLGSGDLSPTSSPAPDQPRSNGATPLVMVVDDDPAIRSYLTQIMQHEGYKVVQAENGRRALDLAQKQRPDLITMDLRMPDMDGRTAITSLRADAGLRQIPIIVISVLPERERAGGDAFFEKPVDEEDLLASTRLFLRQDNGGKVKNSNASQGYLVVNLPDRKTSLPPMPAGQDRITYCCMEEMEQWLVSGFSGMLVVPAESLKDLNLQYIFESSKVLGVIIGGSRSYTASPGQEDR
jgi:CheY-like chemotaxis protein